MARTSRNDWCVAGLAILRDQGHEALTVDRLCAALQKTKGSFYHHFADLETYLGELLSFWEQELTEAPIERASREASPQQRSARLDQVVRGLDHALDVSVRAWARRDERAGSAMQRVDRRRIDYLAELRRTAGHRNARMLAQLEYSAFVGAQQLGYFNEARRAAKLGHAQHEALLLLAKAWAKR